MARRFLVRRHHDLGVAGDFDDARAVFVIDEAEAPVLEVITMGDGDRRCCREAMCTPMEFDLMGVENHLWLLFRLRKWASRRRPHTATVDGATIAPMARLVVAGASPGELISVTADASGTLHAEPAGEAPYSSDPQGRLDG